MGRFVKKKKKKRLEKKKERERKRDINGKEWKEMGERGYIVLNSLLVIKLVYYKIINKFRIIYVENCKIYITKLQKLILSK